MQFARDERLCYYILSFRVCSRDDLRKNYLDDGVRMKMKLRTPNPWLLKNHKSLYTGFKFILIYMFTDTGAAWDNLKEPGKILTGMKTKLQILILW